MLWPDGTDAAPFMGRFDGVSALLAVAAFVALSRFTVGIMPVLAVCAAIGLIHGNVVDAADVAGDLDDG